MQNYRKRIGFNVPEWKNKPFNEFTNEELLEYWYKLRLACRFSPHEITPESTSSDMYVFELQNQILKRMNNTKEE